MKYNVACIRIIWSFSIEIPLQQTSISNEKNITITINRIFRHSRNLFSAAEDKLKSRTSLDSIFAPQMYTTLVFIFAFMNEKKENGPRQAFPDKENPMGSLKWWAAAKRPQIWAALYTLHDLDYSKLYLFNFGTCSPELREKNVAALNIYDVFSVWLWLLWIWLDNHWKTQFSATVSATFHSERSHVSSPSLNNRLKMVLASSFFFFLTWRFGKSKHRPWKIHCSQTWKLQRSLWVLGEAETVCSKLTNSIYTGISQLIDCGLLVDSVLILHLHNSTHLWDKNTDVTSNPHMLLLMTLMMRSKVMRQPHCSQNHNSFKI